VPRWRISLAFAFAASLIAAMLVAIVFLRTANRNESDTVFVTSPELEIPSSSPPPAATTDEKKVTPAPPQKVIPQFARNKRGRVIGTQPVLERRPKTKDLRPSSSVAALTEEEKYAYRQLMIALSVSSSKFKIVKDSINGNENIERTNSTNQR